MIRRALLANGLHTQCARVFSKSLQLDDDPGLSHTPALLACSNGICPSNSIRSAP